MGLFSRTADWLHIHLCMEMYGLAVSQLQLRCKLHYPCHIVILYQIFPCICFWNLERKLTRTWKMALNCESHYMLSGQSGFRWIGCLSKLVLYQHYPATRSSTGWKVRFHIAVLTYIEKSHIKNEDCVLVLDSETWKRWNFVDLGASHYLSA